MSKRTIVLLILDGWGIGTEDESNPIHVVNPININYVKSRFPAGALQASGISVGLPWREEGNSEIGHLNMGVGKVMYQHYPKITLAIRDKSFFQNETFKKAFAHAKQNNSSVHLVGLLSQGIVHSALEHLQALIEFAKQEKVSRLNLHLFTDGRDSPPYSAKELLEKIPKEMLASLAGRFYAMDRDNRWERTEKTYRVLTGEGPVLTDINLHLQKTYDRNLNDEYIDPTLIGPGKRPIQDNDAVIFFNFREDRARQLVAAFSQKDFKKFSVKPFANLYLATMTQYEEDFSAKVAFLPEKADYPLSRVLAEADKTQLRIAETQKYPHVTYFFNGLKEEPFLNEYRALIPSKPVIKQDDHPEMMTAEITNRLIESISEGVFDFILANFANPDMVAHTANYPACLETVRVVDREIGKLIEAVLKINAVLIITSDHGNIEKIFDPLTGAPQTQHDPSPVPFYLIAKEFERQKSDREIREAEKNTIGILADVAPTILDLMKLPKPAEMTGQSLLKFLISNY